MKIQVTEHVIRIVVVAPQERIDAMNAPELRQQLQTLIDDGAVKVVIDLSAVPFMDSAGMAVLVSALKQARQAGGDVRLVWPRVEAARRIFNLTRLDRVFVMAESADRAMVDF